MFAEDRIRQLQDRIPPLHGQHGASDPTVYQRYCFDVPPIDDFDLERVKMLLGYQFLFIEYDKDTATAFGWMMTNGDLANAGFGYANLHDLETKLIWRDQTWEPCRLSEAKPKAIGYLAHKGTEEHYAWWSHFYKRNLYVQFFHRRKPDEELPAYTRRLYKEIAIEGRKWFDGSV